MYGERYGGGGGGGPELSWTAGGGGSKLYEEQGRHHIIFVLHDGDDGDWRPLDRARLPPTKQAQERLQFVRHSIAGLFFEE